MSGARQEAAGAAVVIPEVDILRGAFDRQDPNPAAVGEFTRLVSERRVFLVGWVRQAVLTRTRDDRQFNRLLVALAPFPDLAIQPEDHVQSSWLVRDLRARGLRIQPAQALLWVMAERAGVRVWTAEPGWWALADHGAPVHRSGE